MNTVQIKPGKLPRRSAFTLVELLVVIGVIGLVLAIAVPSVTTMQAQLDRTATIQGIDSALMRAKYSAAAEGAYVALRFLPSAWAGPSDEDGLSTDRDPRRMLIQAYTWTTTDGSFDPTEVDLVERFEPRSDFEEVLLPANYWVAPMEASLDPDMMSGAEQALAESIVEGGLGSFQANPYQGTADSRVVIADDFLVVFDSDGELVPGPRIDLNDANHTLRGNQQRYAPYRIYGYVPGDTDDPGWRDVDGNDNPYARFNFGGVALYNREAYVNRFALNRDAGDRVDFLATEGERQMIHPRSAVLKEAQ